MANGSDNNITMAQTPLIQTILNGDAKGLCQELPPMMGRKGMTTMMRVVPRLASGDFDPNARIVCLEEIEELRQ